VGAYGIETAVIEHIVVYFLNWRHKEDAEDIGITRDSKRVFKIF
jgi:hypothetical protein